MATLDRENTANTGEWSLVITLLVQPNTIHGTSPVRIPHKLISDNLEIC